MKEIRKDLYTPQAYADRHGLTRQAVYYQMKMGHVKTVEINGAKLIKL